MMQVVTVALGRHSATMDYGCQQVLIQDRKLVALLEYLCQQSNKVYNCALYYARQVSFIAAADGAGGA